MKFFNLKMTIRFLMVVALYMVWSHECHESLEPDMSESVQAPAAPRNIFANHTSARKLPVWQHRHIRSFAPLSRLLPPLNCSRAAADYRAQLSRAWRVAYDVTGATATAAGGITLVTHLDADRRRMLYRMLDAWAGPVSAAIYVSEEDADDVIDEIAERGRQNVKVALVLKDGTLYPGNLLRNAALEGVAGAELVYLVDVDFALMPGTEAVLARHAGRVRDREAYVVPAFEMKSDTLDPSLLRGKDALLRAITDRPGQIQPFHMRQWPAGHGPTDYRRWRTASQPYTVQYNVMYEPYVLLRLANAPAYEETFIGRDFNKVSFIYHLHKLRFQFVVLPDVFLVHTAHARERSQMQACSANLWKIWKRHIDETNQAHHEHIQIPE